MKRAWCSGSKRSTLDIEGKIAEWRERAAPSAPPADAGVPSPGGPAAGGPAAGGPVGGPAGTRVLLARGHEVVCRLVPPPALLDDLRTRLDAKDEDNESGIHDAE